MPAISVIMPVFNRATVVGDAIASVLAQDFSDFELLIADDGSTDATRDIVGAIDDPRVRLLVADRNGGSNAARNRGIRAAKSPLLAFLDSDDAYLPDKLSTVTRIFEQRPALDVLVDSFVKTFPPETGKAPVPRHNPTIETTDEFAVALFTRRLWKATSAISVRRGAAIRAGLFDESLKRRQDFDFLARLAKVVSCASTSRILWTKTWTAGAISDDLNSFVRATIDLTQRHPDYLTNARFRPGLARDIARHFGRLLGARRLADARRDAELLRAEYGASMVARLWLDGARSLSAEKRRRSR